MSPVLMGDDAADLWGGFSVLWPVGLNFSSSARRMLPDRLLILYPIVVSYRLKISAQ
jgi:hypothetical protein